MSNTLILGYRRPDKISELLDFISNFNPSTNILVHLDGPKNWEDTAEVAETQSIVLEYKKKFKGQYEWKFNNSNLGCKYGVVSGLTWAFEQHDDLIILEDDIRPSKYFFEYANYNLKKFKNDNRVWQINGWSPIRKNRKHFSYLTHHAHIWGWASWKRAFDLYEPEIPWFTPDYDFRKLEIFKNLNIKPQFIDFWAMNLKRCAEGFDTWDTQWLANMWHHNMYAMAPSFSLCGNVGFDQRATHTTKSGGAVFSYLPNIDLHFENHSIQFQTKEVNFYNEIHDQIGYKLGNSALMQVRKLIKGIN